MLYHLQQCAAKGSYFNGTYDGPSGASRRSAGWDPPPIRLFKRSLVLLVKAGWQGMEREE